MVKNAEVKTNNGYRSLVATSLISKGQLILEERPFALVGLENYIQAELYQKYGWPWVLTFELLRLLSNKEFKSRFEKMNLYSNNSFKLDWVDKELVGRLEKIFGYEKKELLRLYYLVVTNNFLSGGLGCVLYESITASNHSCIPNAYVINEVTLADSIGKMYALQDISKGQEITISYLNSGNSMVDCLALIKEFPSVEERRRKLFLEHYFECICPICISQVQAKSDFKSK